MNRNVGDDSAELVVIRYGRIIWMGEQIDNRHGVWSCTKSFTSTVLGLLIADGKCTLDTRMRWDVLPEIGGNVTPAVTLRHLTTMTTAATGPSETKRPRRLQARTQWDAVSAEPEGPLFTPPGSQYAYWDSAMKCLGSRADKNRRRTDRRCVPARASPHQSA